MANNHRTESPRQRGLASHGSSEIPTASRGTGRVNKVVNLIQLELGTPSEKLSKWALVTLLILGFFCGQLVAEVLLEALFTGPADRPGSTAVVLSVFQYGGCVLFPMGVSFISGIMDKSSKNPTQTAIVDDEESAQLLGQENKVSNNPATSESNSNNESMSLVGLWRRWQPFLLLAGLIYLATIGANLSLNYVQYPVKVVFKSSKLIPTMLVSVAMGNSARFKLIDYFAAVCLCVGAAMFAVFGNKHEGVSPSVDFWNTVIGVGLLVAAVFGDSFVPNLQQSLMQRGYSTEQVIIQTNEIGFSISLIYTTLTGDLYRHFVYMLDHQLLFVHYCALGFLLGLVVWCSTKLIEVAGSVFTVTVATVRKVATILLSFLIFPKPFDYHQFIAVVFVATGMCIQVYKKMSSKK